MVKAFPKSLSVKSYNADLLAVADYSGIQKTVTKFNRAKIIVILRDRPVVLLNGATVKKDLLIVHSVKSDISSDGFKWHVLSQGTNFSALGSKVKKRTISKEADLDDIGAIRASDLLVIDEAEFKMTEAVAHLVKNHLAGK